MAKYYAKGTAVFQEPEGGQMGFKVCDCSEWVEGAAERIATSLNFVELVAVQPLTVPFMNVRTEARLILDPPTGDEICK